MLPLLFGGCGSAIVYGASTATERVADEIVEGQRVRFAVEVGGGSAPFTFQWNKDNMPIPGATDMLLTFDAVQLRDAGSYTVAVTNAVGVTTSAPEMLFVRPALPSRLANVSVITSGDTSGVVGFSLGRGDAREVTRILARAAGPALSQFGLAGVLEDPVLKIFQEPELIGLNDDWMGEDVRNAAVAVGAFPFPTGSKDSAVALSFSPASYTAEVTSATGTTGIAVVELYDLSTGSVSAIPRLVKFSARGMIRGTEKTLTAGFTIQGEASMTVLLRGIGPSLVTQGGVRGALTDPKLTLFRDSTTLATNLRWRDGAVDEIANATNMVGASMLSTDSSDSALLMTLRPGAYTTRLSSDSGSDGMGSIEVYEVSQGER
jgi:hypothetical protein